MTMELKLFTDLIDALGKVACGLRAIVNLPKAERETIHRTLNETYRLIDTTLNMVSSRFATSCFRMSHDDLLREADVLFRYQPDLSAVELMGAAIKGHK